MPANGSAVYRLTDSGPAKPIDKPVTVTDAAESITIDGGGLKLVVSKKSFAGLGRVFVGGRQVSAGGSLTIKGMDGKTYSSASDLADALGVGVSSAKNWSETVAAHRLIQVFLHDADKKKHPEKYR